MQSTGEKQFHFFPVQTFPQNRQGSKQNFETAVVVIVAYKKQPKSVFRMFKLGFRSRWQRFGIARESVRIKSVVHRKNLPATPPDQLLRECRARSDRDLSAP